LATANFTFANIAGTRDICVSAHLGIFKFIFIDPSISVSHLASQPMKEMNRLRERPKFPQ